MGMSAGPARRARRGKAAAISEINVTPMVDVMLVLLIIFMVAAPLMTVGVPIDLPQTQAQAMEPEKRPITVTVTAEGAISVDGEPVALETLAAHVSSLATDGTDERLLVRGDRAAGYGAVMKVMGTLSAAGFSKLGLVSETADVR